MLRLPSIKPHGISGQIIALVVCVILVFQIVTAVLFALTVERPGPLPRVGSPVMADRFVSYVQILDRLPPALRPELMAIIGPISPNLAIEWHPASSISAPVENGHRLDPSEEGLLRHITRVLGPGYQVTVLPAPSASSAASGHRQLRVEAVLSDHSMVAALLPPLRPPPGGPTPLTLLLFSLALIAVLLIAFLFWAARAITAPLARLAGAAESFALDRDPSPLPEGAGPYEVRAASKALNQLQSRVRTMIDNRTRMLAAISHDLRTPITRMRLRAEFIDQGETRELMLRDLDQMDRMVRAALSYLREGPSVSHRELIDIASLLQTICNDFFDLGGDVSYNGPNRLLVRCDIDEIRRAVTNLIENSLRYAGTRVTVELRTMAESLIVIDVIDHGPGIPSDVKEAMLAPFVRGDAGVFAKDRTTGFGLGLAIAKSAAEAHGGKLCLLDALPTGLVARLQLPIRADLKQSEQ
jgi:signal transduction histidine kinase